MIGAYFQAVDDTGTLAGGWQFDAPDQASLAISIAAAPMLPGWTLTPIASIADAVDNRIIEVPS